MRRPRLALQERGAALYPVLNRLQGVLVTCSPQNSKHLLKSRTHIQNTLDLFQNKTLNDEIEKAIM